MKKGRNGQIILFEIPIYSMPEQVFLDKWKRKLDKEAARQSEITPIDKHMSYEKKKQITWHYNQIVGYVTVNVYDYDNEISINAYMRTRDWWTPEDRNQRFDSSRKPYIEDINCLGFDFNLDEYPVEELKHEIKERVKSLIKVYVRKPLYPDTSLFDATLDSVDIMKLIETRKRQGQETNYHK